MTKKALITGITGQDGSYLSEFLLEKDYEVHGLIRRSSSFNTARINHLYTDPHDPQARLKLYYADLTDGARLRELLAQIKPDEVYHLGAQSHVRVSFDEPVYTAQVDAIGTVRLLEAVRDTGLAVRFYQASSSEMFGQAAEVPQKETTPRDRAPCWARKARTASGCSTSSPAWASTASTRALAPGRPSASAKSSNSPSSPTARWA